ncbi:MAG TPA: hypothetical protein VFG76_03460, partial [Candidatus Polarisedimenticolia bacterium]|nr:hypothetical protein [Candidatus Polarisedimenticolia bacterium]
MSEQAQVPPPAKSPAARLAGVIFSPGDTFTDIAARPDWIFPLVCYLAVFLIAFSIYSVRADWIGIVTDQMEGSSVMKFFPDAARAEMVKKATEDLRAQTPGQRAAGTVIQSLIGILPFIHFVALIHASLFVLMGALRELKLGRAWLNFLLCIGLMVAFVIVTFISRAAFHDAPQSALLLNGAGALLMTAGWIWLLKRRTDRDPDLNKVISVWMYAGAVGIIYMLAILGVSLMTQAPIQASLDKLVKTNLGAFMGTGVPILKAIADSLDLFTLWTLVVLSIGFRAVTKLSTGVATSITFLPWGIVVMIRIAIAAAFG